MTEWMLSARPGYGCATGRLLSEMCEILKLAVPTVLGLVSTVAMAAVDTRMLAPLGDEVVAAVGLSASAFIFVNSALIGFISVIGVKIAQADGSGDVRAMSTAVSSGLMLAMILSLVAAAVMSVTGHLLSLLAPNPDIASLAQIYWFALTLAVIPHTLLAAFRGAYAALGYPWTALFITLLGIALNIPLNQLLIHGFAGFDGFGLLGAGLASFLAKALAVSIFVWHVSSARNVKLQLCWRCLSKGSITTQLRAGLPVAVGSVAEGGAYAVTGFMAALLGATALAAHQVVHSVGVMFYMVPIGMMIASSIRTGQVIGARRRSDALCTLVAANLITFVWSVGVLGLVLALRVLISEAMSPSQEVMTIAAQLFLTMAFVQFADCAQSNALGVLRGLSDNLVPNAITLFAYWLLALPLAAFLGFYLGLGVVGLSVGYGAVVLAVAAVLQLRALRYFERH